VLNSQDVLAAVAIIDVPFGLIAKDVKYNSDGSL